MAADPIDVSKVAQEFLEQMTYEVIVGRNPLRYILNELLAGAIKRGLQHLQSDVSQRSDSCQALCKFETFEEDGTVKSSGTSEVSWINFGRSSRIG